MKKLQTLATCLLVLACSPGLVTSGRSPSNPAMERDTRDVVAAVERLFDAMRARDTAALRAVIDPGAQLVSVRPVAGSPAVVRFAPVSAWISSVARAPEPLDERMWDPRVEVAGDIASVWAPYDFRIGARFSHCGHDAVHLARTSAGWKIVGITYTVVTGGCATR